MKAHSSIVAHESRGGPARSGPSMSAIPFMQPGDGSAVSLLDAAETERLAGIASIVCFAKGARIYEAGDKAESIYNVIKGEVKTFCALSSGRRRVTAFLGSGDLAGLAENGRYISTAQALTPVTAYRMPLNALDHLLRSDPVLEHHFLCKLCHDLRASQSHAIMLGRHDALGKLAMFLQQLAANNPTGPTLARGIFLSMTRSDVADYLGLSLEAVSRSFHKLEQLGIIRLDDRHIVQIVDQARFEKLVAAA